MKFLGLESGVSMIELVISLGITAATVVGVSTFMVNSADHKAQIALVAARDSIYNKSLKYISNRSYISSKFSSTNGEFTNCWSDDSRNCTKTSIKNRGDDLSINYGTKKKDVLIGTPDNPAIYNRWGVNCGTKQNARISSNCKLDRHVWEVFVEYWFSCSNLESRCKKPTGANFKIYVNKNPALKSNPSWNPFNGIQVNGRSPDFWLNIPLKKQQKSASKGVRCQSLGTYQAGLYKSGKPKCECLPTHEATGRLVFGGQPECKPLSCIVGTTNNIGVDKNGKPICVDKRYKISCGSSFKVADKGKDCGQNGWIQKFDLGSCKVIATGGNGGKKGGGSKGKYIECSKDKITCCKWIRK